MNHYFLFLVYYLHTHYSFINMTPKQKAEELFDKMCMNDGDEFHHCTHYVAKQCSLIAVGEIIKAIDNPDETYLMKDDVNYWEEVKSEINNL